MIRPGSEEFVYEVAITNSEPWGWRKVTLTGLPKLSPAKLESSMLFIMPRITSWWGPRPLSKIALWLSTLLLLLPGTSTTMELISVNLCLILGKKTKDTQADVTGKSARAIKRIEERQKDRFIEQKVAELFSQQRLYACISSRPGQSGRADGYILEGK